MSTVARRGILLLALACIVGALLALAAKAPDTVVFVMVSIPAAIVLAVAAALGITAAAARLRALAIVGGALLIVAAIVQLAQLPGSGGLLAGDGSTMSLLGGLGIGMLVLGLAAEGPGSVERRAKPR